MKNSVGCVCAYVVSHVNLQPSLAMLRELMRKLAG